MDEYLKWVVNINKEKPHSRAHSTVNRVAMLDLLGRCNEIGTVRGFIKITLNNKDLVAVSSVPVPIFNCDEVPKRKHVFDLKTENILQDYTSYNCSAEHLSPSSGSYTNNGSSNILPAAEAFSL